MKEPRFNVGDKVKVCRVFALFVTSNLDAAQEVQDKVEGFLGQVFKVAKVNPHQGGKRWSYVLKQCGESFREEELDWA